LNECIFEPLMSIETGDAKFVRCDGLQQGDLLNGEI
jgi:hypothetical protein